MLAIEEAKRTIGDYKLKTSPIFDLSEKRTTLASKYKEILNCRKKVHVKVYFKLYIRTILYYLYAKSIRNFFSQNAFNNSFITCKKVLI